MVTTPKPDAFEAALEREYVTSREKPFELGISFARRFARWSRMWTRANDPDVRALVEALKSLLADSQHADHKCSDLMCPVDNARDALAAWKEKTNGNT